MTRQLVWTSSSSTKSRQQFTRGRSRTITDLPSATLSSKNLSTLSSLCPPLNLPRKLSRTCKEASRKKVLEKRYSNLCLDVVDVIANNACPKLFDADKLVVIWNKTRLDAFEEKVFKYMQENVALLNIFIKEPYCVKISQERKYPL